MYTKFILNKNEVITIIALLAGLRTQIRDIKDSKTRDEILDFMSENFNDDDIVEIPLSNCVLYDNICYLKVIGNKFDRKEGEK